MLLLLLGDWFLIGTLIVLTALSVGYWFCLNGLGDFDYYYDCLGDDGDASRLCFPYYGELVLILKTPVVFDVVTLVFTFDDGRLMYFYYSCSACTWNSIPL